MGNTATKRHMLSVAFVWATLLMLVMPAALMPWFGGEASNEKRALAEFPQLTGDEGKPNRRFFEEFGTWFADHFAFRAQLVDLDATIRQRIFLQSATDEVVVGTNGWLYYAGDLNDYRRWNRMSEEALDNAVFNLVLMQEMLQEAGKRFVVCVVPNKATLYPQHMPYYELAGEGQSNLERLETRLREAGVHVVSLADEFAAHDEVLYLERDSHWTNQGALVGYDALIKALGRQHETYEAATQQTDNTHVGDIDAMLHPVTARPEQQVIYPKAQEFTYLSKEQTPDGSYVVTRSTRDGAQNTLLMFRDSYGDAILPYMASAYGQAVFTRLVPYDMGTKALSGVDDVIVERVERHLARFASKPPYMPAPRREGVVESQQEDTDTTCKVSINGGYLVVEGTLDEALMRDGAGTYRVYVRINHNDKQIYEAFHVSPDDERAESATGVGSSDAAITNDGGYLAYLDMADLSTSDEGSVDILFERNDKVSCVHVQQLDWNE